MEKTYSPEQIEKNHYKRWEDNNWFSASGKGDPYCIMIPPPNVTGVLHMGHAFQDTIMDTLIRYHRMCGDNTHWQGGMDHAGIATQMVVERLINAEGKSRHEFSREEFIDQIWQWKSQSGGAISNQLRRMGVSLDWNKERFTMDEGLSDAVTEVFVRLYEKGLIYKGKRLVNWDPVLHTAVSDLEVLQKEEKGHLYHLRYPLSNGEGHLTVATTRPETMLGDTAVAVHPEDERYKHLIGQTILLPLVDREIPIIADEYVDSEFGSGCVKITPAHDFNDYQIGQRHQLPMINILNDDASIDLPDSKYHDLDRYIARKEVLEDFKKLGLLEAVVDHKMIIPRGDRSNSVIEPYLTDQWFVNVAPMAEKAIKVVESGEVKFIPANWVNTYNEWMNNIEDWCISRQIWWGHRIPAWYDDNGNIYVARDAKTAQQQADAKLGFTATLRQDEDVLDTWFSSALWPFSTLGWPQQTDDLKTFYPTSVLVTGFDIIFFWVARMIMFGVEFTGKIPFHDVFIHGLVRDSDGQKMSKSKGNVLDPLDLIDGISLDKLLEKRTSGLMQPHLQEKIEKSTRKQFPDGIPAYGTDALRFTFTSLASLGRDIRFDLGRIQGNKNFCNKLWNAARFVLMNMPDQHNDLFKKDYQLSVCDRWIISHSEQVKQKCRESIESYRFDLLSQTLYQFIWDDYCSWYLEFSKAVLNDENTDEKIKTGTRRTLISLLEIILRLLHPIMPFITEEIWQSIKQIANKSGDSIMLQAYPKAKPENDDPKASEQMLWIQNIISAVRNIRSEVNIPPGKLVPVLLKHSIEDDKNKLDAFTYMLKSVGRIDTIELISNNQKVPESASALAGHLQVMLPLGSLIDTVQEKARLQREIAKLQKSHELTTKKLDNPHFTDKAPPAIVEKEKKQLVELNNAIKQLESQLKELKK